MDPADEAALYLTATFEKMKVPCKVKNTNDKGKHVIATTDIPAQSDLFEEAPIVSWPAEGYIAFGIPFCSHCLRQRRETEILDENGEKYIWSACNKCNSLFCSSSCESSSKIIHQILCSSLKKLREEDDNQSIDIDSNNRYKPITKESLAKCVAWIISRIATSIKQQNFSGKMLEENHKGNTESIARQIFHLAIAPFNRLVDAPRGTEFTDIDPILWYNTLNKLLRDSCLNVLLEATASPPSSNNDWANEIIDALLRHDTLKTFLGQLTLNSQALNSFVLGSSHVEEKSPSAIPPINWVLKGAGIYTLQSAFNHSCQPNVTVIADKGTHDITLRTLHRVKNGEELTITYIPLENLSREERHAKLKDYFFTCHCPKCENEVK